MSKISALIPDRALTSCLTLTLLIPALANARLSAGWLWDFINGLGFAAFAGLLYLCIASPRIIGLNVHQKLSYALIGLLLVHAISFLVFDPLVIEYLKLGAPLYMWAGVLSLFLLVFLVVVALNSNRMRAHKNHKGFKSSHKLLSYSAVATALYHIIASRFYIQTLWQAAALCITALIIFKPDLIQNVLTERSNGHVPPETQSKTLPITIFITYSLLFACIFTTYRNLLA